MSQGALCLTTTTATRSGIPGPAPDASRGCRPWCWRDRRDLAKKKLLPAMYDLANRGLLPPSFSLVGFQPPRMGRRAQFG